MFFILVYSSRNNILKFKVDLIWWLICGPLILLRCLTESKTPSNGHKPPMVPIKKSKVAVKVDKAFPSY